MVGLAAKLILALLKEIARLLADLDHPVWWGTKHLDYSGDLVVLGGTREQGQAKEQLDYDTAERPHVDCRRIGKAQKNLWRSVESRLDVGVHCLTLVAGRSKINYLDDRAFEVLQQDVLRFQIAVDEAGLVEQGQAVEQLLSKHTHQGGAKASELVLLDQFVQVDAKEFENQAEMLAMDEGILQSQQMVVVVLIQFRIQEIKHGDLHHTLVEIGRPVLDYFDGHDLLRLEVLAFDNLPKGTLTEHVKDQITIPMCYALVIMHGNHRVYVHLLVSCFLGSQDIVDI